MRPIYKGPWPTTPRRRLQQTFTDWTKAIPILIRQTGSYCHLCEMHIPSAIEIEHILPKIHFPARSSDWDNFILACTHCNSSKNDIIPLGGIGYVDHYYYPHLHNTFMAFDYNIGNGCLPSPSPSRTVTQTTKAQNLITLYKLNKITNSNGELDNRHKYRLQALQKACDRRVEFGRGLCTEAAIVDMAKSTGFLSVWLEVFKAVPSIKNALLNDADFHLNSQSPMSFDSALVWLPRNNGNPTDNT